MHRFIRTLLLAGPAGLAVAAGTAAEARGSGGAGFRGSHHHGLAHRFKRAPVAATGLGPSGHYLSDDAWFLSDIGGYMADDPTYPNVWNYGYGYPAYLPPVGYGYRRPVSYTVPAHGSPHVRRVVTVHRGVGRAVHAAFRPRR